MRSCRVFAPRNSAISFALRSSSTTKNSSPAFGASSRPRISTGIDGPASPIGFFISSVIALILPTLSPANIKSPLCKVPCWINAVATTPRPLSTRASTITPLAGTSTGALSSKSSACRTTASNNSAIPSPVSAETLTN